MYEIVNQHLPEPYKIVKIVKTYVISFNVEQKIGWSIHQNMFFIRSHGGRAVRRGGTWAGMWVSGALAVPLMYPALTPAHLHSHGVGVT